MLQRFLSLSEAIQNMNSGKAPGLDGLPIEFYKTFKTKLVEPLLNMFKECFLEGTLPPTIRLALTNPHPKTRQTIHRVLVV